VKPKKANNSKACLGGQGKPTKQKPSRLAQGPPQATPPPCRQADIMQSKRTAPQADLEGPGAKVYPLTESRKPALVRLNRQQKGGHSSYRKTDLDQPAESSKQPIENPLQASSIKKRQNQRQHRLLIGWPFLRRRQKETKPYRTSETPKHSSWGEVAPHTGSLVKGLFRRRETALSQQTNPDRQRPVVAMVPIGSTLLGE